jgi:hypothetical protein
MAIGGYFVNGCWWLLMAIILMTIGSYFVNDHWWLFHCKPMVVILFMPIYGY